MPHIVIEYSKQLEAETDIQALCYSAVDSAFETGLFNSKSDIKARGIGYEHTVVNLPSSSFVHITIWLLEGRTDVQKAELTSKVADNIEVRLPTIGSLTVDVRDMRRDTYVKRVKAD